MTFLENTCKVDFIQTRNIIAVALLIGTPLFIYFGWLSDRIGRKMIMMAGMLMAVILYRPIYGKMYEITDLSTKQELPEQKVINKLTSVDESGATVTVATTERIFTGGVREVEVKTETEARDKEPVVDVRKSLVLDNSNFWMMVVLVLVQVVLVTMVYGPIAAFLVELFPTRIRYTSMSLPYHIGNGVFGGLTPYIALSLYEASKTTSKPDGDPFAGLLYPIIVAGVCFIIGMIFLKNKKNSEVMS
jgi:MHS family proline/betaine transporter-like MFS transporter